ncbi:lipocalin family protein [Bernardetia sp. Wsw4-3y2]|uniref:lipocalin family protein n=1 Tax=Bernardetia sp. Wsw4-3y2 TaxID=3127471 RepID=UPI0030D1AA4A
MKKQFLFVFLIILSFTTLFTSCKKDDEDVTEEIKESIIIGRWEGETVTISVNQNGVILPTQTHDISNTMIEFNADGTYNSTGNDEDGNLVDNSGTWKLSNGDKEIIFDASTEDEDIYTIDTLTESDLKISSQEEETIDPDQGTITASITTDFKR